MAKKLKELCNACHRRPAADGEERCLSCQQFENPCSRCARAEAYVETVTDVSGETFEIKRGRCLKCLNYAADYEKRKTTQRRLEERCIVCGKKTKKARCKYHAQIKTENSRKNAA
jgi:hypothetical protein